MKWEEIVKKYKDEWVLLEVIRVDKNMKIKEGKILSHSKDKNDIYNKLVKVKPKKFAIEFTGKIPDDLAVVDINIFPIASIINRRRIVLRA